MDNLDVFKKNGFTFEIDETSSPTKRVKLLTIPMSKNWIFGKEDIEELLFMLRVCIESTITYFFPFFFLFHVACLTLIKFWLSSIPRKDILFYRISVASKVFLACSHNYVDTYG